MTRVVIIEYGMGNVDSVKRAVEECGREATVSADRADILEASHLILPGVGAFAEGMRNLRARGLETLLTEQVRERTVPLLGICLGMQLFGTTGLEGGETAGLGWIPGEVRRLVPQTSDERIPHVGWNEVRQQSPHPLFENISDGKDFYFVHSYHLSCLDSSDVAATTPYCGGFVSAVARGSMFGVQFHPEKSQKAGFQLLKNFLAFR